MGNKSYTLDQILNMYSPEPNSGCWLWYSNIERDGYGIVVRQRKRTLAHRFFYNHYFGEIPKGMVVMHKCDTPACVNPAHLTIGFPRDNSADMVNKGRSLKGEKNHQYGKPGTCLGRKGEKHPMFGKHHSEESKRKISITSTGKKRKPCSDETKAKISHTKKMKFSGVNL